MYLISHSPNKIIASKTRRALPQNCDKIEIIKDIKKKPVDGTNDEEYSVPRPVFQTTKKSIINRHDQEEETLSPQHQEIVKYINDSWNMIVAQNPYDNPKTPDRNHLPSISSSSNSSIASFYCVEPPSPVLSDFKPFDLESWWGRRLFNNITKSL